MQPFEDRHASGQSLLHFFAGQLVGAPAARLKFRADVGLSQFSQFFHRHFVKAAGVFVAKQKAAGVPIKHHDGLRCVLDQGAEAGLAGAQSRRAFADTTFQRLRQFQQCPLRLLALAYVAGDDHIDVFPAHEDRSRGRLDRNVPSIQSPDHPFEPMRFLSFDNGDNLGRLVDRPRAIGLERR
jgi:hypothetical protein